MKNDKIQQNPTNMERVNKETGLTPLQERAASLLVAGKSYTEIANELQIDRSTLYSWTDKLTFKAYFNKLNKEIQDQVKNNLVSMYNDAVKAFQESLNSSVNPAIRLKAACWLFEKLEQQKIGSTDPRSFLRQMATESVWPEMEMVKINQTEYRKLCKENGIDP